MSAKKKKLNSETFEKALEYAIKITKVLERDKRYDPEAYNFVLGALDYTLHRKKVRRHISGGELLDGIRAYAMKLFGPMAKTVLGNWGIKETDDFGEIVFNMVEEGMLSKRDEDTKEEFKDGYDFSIAFEEPFRRSLKPHVVLNRNKRHQS